MFHCLWLTPTGVCGCSGGDKNALKCGLKLWKKVFGLGLIWLSSYTYMYVVCRCWEEEGLVEHTVWMKKLLETTWLDLTWLDLTWLDSTRLDSTWLDLTRLDSTWLDLTRLDSTWLNLTWLDLTQLDST